MIATKPLRWSGTAWADLKAFPDEARREAGHQLFRLQCGLTPDDFKPMPSVGGGVYEIRVRQKGAYRVFYIAKYPEAVHVLHAFEKRSQKTDRRDIAIAQQRLARIERDRRAIE
jgi:phage-related protein